MNRTLLCLFASLCLATPQHSWGKTPQKFALVIHGGAGSVTRENMSPEKEVLYRTTMAMPGKALFSLV